MSSGGTDAQKVEKWDALKNETEKIVLGEETAFKDAFSKEFHFYVEGLQISDAKAFVLNETKRQISVAVALANDTQDIMNFLAELLHPKKDSTVSVGNVTLYFICIKLYTNIFSFTYIGSYFTYYRPQGNI
jgi:hypothetical protein